MYRHIYMHTNMHLHLHIHILMYTYICIYLYVYAKLCIHLHIHVYIERYIYIYEYMYTELQFYIYECKQKYVIQNLGAMLCISPIPSASRINPWNCMEKSDPGRAVHWACSPQRRLSSHERCDAGLGVSQMVYKLCIAFCECLKGLWYLFWI